MTSAGPFTVSLDTETTGKDFYHGSMPFLVTTCHGDENEFWHWRVDPRTRAVAAPRADLRRIRELIGEADLLVLQNARFDYTALYTLGGGVLDFWDWSKVRDTLIAGHLVDTSSSHTLDDMAAEYLRMDISRYEKALKEATVQARTRARNRMKTWRIAKKGDPSMPSARDETWKIDTWLPREIAIRLRFPDSHPWHTVTEEYANADSSATLLLWRYLEREIWNGKLDKIFAHRSRVVRVVQKIEARGVTMDGAVVDRVEAEFREERDRASAECVRLARKEGYDLDMPKGGNNQSLRVFVFEHLALPVYKSSEKTGEPSLDKEVMEKYELNLPAGSRGLKFIRALKKKRAFDTAISYIEGYRRFRLPLRRADGSIVKNWWVLHPNLNPTGTATLRYSSSNPNGQNLSKKEAANLRQLFGPAPGRETWALDARNIELRLPAYESGEEAFIALFEHPDDPPYFGSNHLLVAHVLWEQEFEECLSCLACGKTVPNREKKEGVKYCGCRRPDPLVDGRVFKRDFADTLYDRVKRGNFAIQYQAQDREDGTGTADRAYGIPGAQSRLKQRFTKQDALSQHYVRFAMKHGYVETMPDRSVDPERGYPIRCGKTAWGRIRPTTPFSYHVQGSVGEWMTGAMIRCQDRLDEWNAALGYDDYFIDLQVHDELRFDFPRTETRPEVDAERERRGRPIRYRGSSNLWRVREMQRLMELGGENIGVPTPVSAELHEDNYAVGKGF